MRFRVAGNKIICSRRDRTVRDGDPYRRVVEFDAQVDKVPPHVASRLTKPEIRELRQYLADRARLQAEPAAENMLHVLPDMLNEAAESLQDVEQINKSTFCRINESLERFKAELQKITPKKGWQAEGEKQKHSMPRSDEFRHRLERVSHDV